MNLFKRLIASVLIVSTTLMGLPLTAQASVVTTTEAMSSEVADANRDKVAAFLAREDVRTALEAQGVSSAAATDRVKAMSDAEVAQLADRVDQAPAGGILGFIFVLFLVLLVTDILGLTKVFPFTRSAR
ncbi:PA2779 family protein [Polaromonas sp.]|uniref:PA2779 family protein n=1 Tax=Polaromonas sp. TaxID=1869339 RepID=UPI002FC6CADF